MLYLTAIAAVFSGAGCASLGTYNPATGKSEFIFISTPEEVSLGSNIHRELATQFNFSDNQTQLARIERIGQRLAAVSDRKDYQYQFYLIDKDEINAFTTPGGNIYFYTGLLNILPTDEQVASVLAHEIGHCAARHTIKKFQAAMGYDLIGSIILGQVGGQAKELASLSSGMIMNIVFSAYGRKDEYEADRLGIKYLSMAGYDPYASVEALEALHRESGDGGAPLVLRSHPYLTDRIKAVRQEIELIKSGRVQPAGL